MRRILRCGENNETEGAKCLTFEDGISSFEQITTESCNNTDCLDDVEMFLGPEVNDCKIGIDF